MTMLKILTENMAPWKAIATLPTSGGPANQVVDYRKEYINMTATGLVIIGHVAYEIEKNSDAEWRHARYQDLATKIDWRRDSEMWQGNIISDDKITTTRGPGRVAAKKVMKALGLITTEQTIPLQLQEDAPAQTGPSY